MNILLSTRRHTSSFPPQNLLIRRPLQRVVENKLLCTPLEEYKSRVVFVENLHRGTADNV